MTIGKECRYSGTSLQARFKRRAIAVPNSIDRIKFDFSTAVARRLKPSRDCRVARQGLPCYAAVTRLSFKRRAELNS